MRYSSIHALPRHYTEVSCQLYDPTALLYGKKKPVTTVKEAVLAPEPVGTFLERKLTVLPGFKPRTVHPAN